MTEHHQDSLYQCDRCGDRLAYHGIDLAGRSLCESCYCAIEAGLP